DIVVRHEDEASCLERDVADRRPCERAKGSARVRGHDHRRVAEGRAGAGAEVIGDRERSPAARHASAAPAPMRLRWVVSALGIAQIISWGSLYYPIAVLASAIRDELHMSEVAVFGSFTVGLFVSGFAAPAVGRLIDAHGGRIVLAGGSACAAAALAV